MDFRENRVDFAAQMIDLLIGCRTTAQFRFD